MLNTNKLKMPLLVFIRIFNLGKIFSFVLYLIIFESATTFEFMKDKLDEIFFHNCE